MRTNYSGFALAACMGLIVVLLGLLVLSVGGLVQLGPAAEQAAVEQPAPSASPEQAVAAAVKPLTAEQQAGDALFQANCAQCHAVNEKVVGPALAGITTRRRLPWLTAWVHNSAKVIASGDDYAVKLFDDNGKQQMPAFPQLSDQDIRAIMTWVESQGGSSVTTTAAVVAAK